MSERPVPFARYRHFKGKEYQVLMIAKSSEDGSEQVVYQALYEPYTIYVRPLSSFMSGVDREKYPDAPQEERFRRIEGGMAEGAEKPKIQTAKAAQTPDPGLVRFLDAESNEEKLRVLDGIQGKLTPEMLRVMEVSCSLSVEDQADIEARYLRIRSHLQYKMQYERNRR